MSELCLGCNIGFVKGPKGYSRVKVLNIASPHTTKAVFPNAASPKKDSFICHGCLRHLNQQTRVKKKHTSKRTIMTPTTSPSPTKQAKTMASPTTPSTSSPPVEKMVTPTTPIPSSTSSPPVEKMITPTTPIPSSTSSPPVEKMITPTTPIPSTSTPPAEKIRAPTTPFLSTSTPPVEKMKAPITPIPSTSSTPIEKMSAPTTPIPPSSTHYSSTHTSEKMSSPETPSSTQTPSKKSSFGKGPLAHAKYYLRNHEYLPAFRCFLNSPVRRHVITACSQAINRERKKLSSDPNGPLKRPINPTEISSFSWDDVLDWASRKAPLLTGCLRATFPPEGNRQTVKTYYRRGRKTLANVALGKRRCKKQATSKGAFQLQKHTRRNWERERKFKQRTGMALAIAVFSSSQKANFIQKCVGIELWKQGSSQKVIKTMNHMGVSMSVNATREAIDDLWLGHDEKIKDWKEQAEEKQTLKRRLFGPAAKKRCSYSVTWDNVQMFVQGKHQSKDHANKFLLFAPTFAHQNKVNFSDLPGAACRAIEVQPSTLLPTLEVFQRLRKRMVILVMRILVDNLPALSPIHQMVEQHIPHAYTKVMNDKSNIVNLGVVAANPSSNAGVIEIMRYLHEFVPVVGEEPLPILCCSDGLSVDRMINCKQMTNGGRTSCQRLDGLIPTPQEFHKEMLLLQDSMNLLYDPDSECARGTIAQLKNYFTHRSLKKKVSANVQHAWDMMEFATSAYVTLLATTICGMSTVADVPENLPHLKADKVTWLETLAHRIVDFAWMPPEQGQINLVAASAASPEKKSEKDYFLYCHCQKDKEETMVKCCSSLCEIGWLHLSCAGLTEAPEKDMDYFCSEKCTEDGTFMYCTCQQRKGGQMVQCQMAENCKKKEWYHLKCLLPSDRVDAQDKWYCSGECATDGSGEDFVQNYTKALMWEGLNHLARRDAVREGDGPAMVDSWKLDLLQFWGRSHPKYFIIGHHMLTGIGGFLPEKLQSDLTWNRVANMSGRPGGNVGLDLVNEFLNNDFKEMMKRSHGNYTAKEVQRCAEMGGAFGKDLDRLLSNAGVVSFEGPWSRSDSHKRRQVEDIEAFVKEFKPDDLFSNVPGRFHDGLENFRYNNNIKKPKNMGRKMRRLAVDMDRWDVFAGLKPVV